MIFVQKISWHLFYDRLLLLGKWDCHGIELNPASLSCGSSQIYTYYRSVIVDLIKVSNVILFNSEFQPPVFFQSTTTCLKTRGGQGHATCKTLFVSVEFHGDCYTLMILR